MISKSSLDSLAYEELILDFLFAACSESLYNPTEQKKQTKFMYAKFQNIVLLNYIILRSQRLAGKQCRFR